MRLTSEEIAAIRDCAARHFGEGSTVRLFGSRIDDRRRGGDIDLHIETPHPDRARLEAELAFLEDLKDRIGDQKIDLVVRRFGEQGVSVDAVARREGLVIS